MEKRLFVVTLEPLEQRYTKQWYKYWKKEFSKYCVVKYIDGKMNNDKISKGRFLDINMTNIWKSEQIIEIAKLFNNEKIKEGDTFIFMDGWHYGITALKYMSQLNNIPIKTYAYWHAGTWDDNDFITQAGLKDWAMFNEEGWFKACDGHFVATQYHKDLIVNSFDSAYKDKIHVVGFPMNWKKEIDSLISKKKVEKENIIVFPHRLDKEKCPEVFDRLAKSLPQYKFIKTLEVTKNKKEYYELLKKAKIIFSASSQETFGIGTVEALCLDCIPVVPDRDVYKELYSIECRYKQEKNIKYFINNFITNYEHKYRSILLRNKYTIINKSLKAIECMAIIMGLHNKEKGCDKNVR